MVVKSVSNHTPVSGVFVYSIVTSIICIYLIVRADKYLISLKGCDCVQSDNLETILTMEKVIIGLMSIGVLSNVYFLFTHNHIGKNIHVAKYFILIYAILIFSFYTYFIYNIFVFQRNIKNNCECALKWQRYILYGQAFVYSSIFLLPLVALFSF
jgi:hypothetical protein